MLDHQLTGIKRYIPGFDRVDVNAVFKSRTVDRNGIPGDEDRLLHQTAADVVELDHRVFIESFSFKEILFSPRKNQARNQLSFPGKRWLFGVRNGGKDLVAG
jgi:hypothetical protein